MFHLVLGSTVAKTRTLRSGPECRGRQPGRQPPVTCPGLPSWTRRRDEKGLAGSLLPSPWQRPWRWPRGLQGRRSSSGSKAPSRCGRSPLQPRVPPGAGRGRAGAHAHSAQPVPRPQGPAQQGGAPSVPGESRAHGPAPGAQAAAALGGGRPDAARGSLGQEGQSSRWPQPEPGRLGVALRAGSCTRALT